MAQCAGGAASTTGFWDGPPTVSGAALGDSNSGMHLLIGILTALVGREKTGLGQKVSVSTQDPCLICAGSSCATSSASRRSATWRSIRDIPTGTFTDAVPRGGNAGGGGQPGWVLKCKGADTDPDAYIYFTIQDQNWEQTCRAVGKPEWIDDPAYNTAKARETHIFEIFDEIETWLADKTKYEVVELLRTFEVPCAPVLSMKEIAHDPALRASGRSSRSSTRSAVPT